MWWTFVSAFLVCLHRSSSFIHISFNHNWPKVMQSYVQEINNFNSFHASRNLSLVGLPISTDYVGFGTPFVLNEYDFVIVGSGPAGCVLANRLSENPKWNILLLEAGEEENFLHRIPVFAAYFQSTASNWDYLTEPDDNFCWGMKNKKCGFPRGKGLGGTSIINYMIYNRGNRRDFDGWARDGNTGWSYNDVLPYFKKSERMTSTSKRIDADYHNRFGELNVEDIPYRTPYARAFVRGAKQLGHKQVDYNGEQQTGVSYVQANTLNGRRHSAARAFLAPIVKKRKNLHILMNARATKILIDANSKTAYGVEYVRNKNPYQVRARREVILSAGAFNSPQLLMLSGIGPKEHLQQINIPVVNDLPVGQILYDHMSHFGPTFLVNTTGFTLNAEKLGISDLKDFFRGKGKLALIGGVEALALLKSKNSKDPHDWPDYELIFVPGSLSSDQGTGLRRGMKIRKDYYDAVYKPLENPNIDHWSVMVMQFRPKSFGNMKLKDNNPFHWPLFYPKYFQYEEDIDVILQGIKEAIKISKTPAMQAFGSRIYDKPLPNCAHLHFGTDEYWRCSIRTFSCTLHHQIGTCKMGPKSDRTAIVDPELKVHGIQRLRVADTSVAPKPISGHTNAISYMIGEKCADMIKKEWSKIEEGTKLKH